MGRWKRGQREELPSGHDECKVKSGSCERTNVIRWGTAGVKDDAAVPKKKERGNQASSEVGWLRTTQEGGRQEGLLEKDRKK